jgi:hypothetical protein
LKAVTKAVFAAEDRLTKALEERVATGELDRVADAAAISAQQSAGSSSGGSPDGSALTPGR